MSASILDIKNATVFRGKNRVFDGLSLTIKQHEHTAILGPNGAGKTTLLKLITRELMPVAKLNSHCRLFGLDRFTIWDLRKKIGVVSHEFQNQYRSLATGLEVVLSAYFGSVGLHQHHEISQGQLNAAMALMEKMELLKLADQPYLQLSTGQQRRLLLARALIHKPLALIFDEPTSGLDMKSAFQLMNEMRRLASEGVSLLLVTHHLQEVIPEIGRIVMLNEGKVFADGKKESLLTSAVVSDLYQTPVQVNAVNGYYQATPENAF